VESFSFWKEIDLHTAPSPRWLISVGQDDKALAILRRAAKVNGINVDEQFHEGVKLKDEEVEESGFLDLLSRKWRKLTILLWLTWIGYAIGYYGCILLVTRGEIIGDKSQEGDSVRNSHQ